MDEEKSVVRIVDIETVTICGQCEKEVLREPHTTICSKCIQKNWRDPNWIPEPEQREE